MIFTLSAAKHVSPTTRGKQLYAYSLISK